MRKQVIYSGENRVFQKVSLFVCWEKMTKPYAHARVRYLPVTAYQADMVATSANPQTSDAYHLYFTLQVAFRISSGLRSRLLKTAFDKLVERHDSLRLRFVEHQQAWMAEVLDAHPTGFQFTDLSDASPDARKSFVEALAQTPIRAHEDPCFQMDFVKCGEEGDVLILRAHHAIVDGYGLIVLTEDLIKHLIRMPLLDKPLSYDGFVTKIDELTRTGKTRKQAFWMNRLLPLPDELQIGRPARGLAPFAPQIMDKTVCLNKLFSDKESQALEKLSSSTGASLFALIYVAFSEAICATADQSAAMICSWLGRHDSWTQRFVGCDHRMVQHIYQCSSRSVLEKAETVRQDIMDAIEGQPSDIFSPGSPLMDVLETENRTLWRFQVHNTLPSARMNSSLFSNLMWTGVNEKISIGPFFIEKLSFPRDCESRFELSVFIIQTPSGVNARLVADDRAFSVAELEQIKVRMKDILFN